MTSIDNAAVAHVDVIKVSEGHPDPWLTGCIKQYDYKTVACAHCHVSYPCRSSRHNIVSMQRAVLVASMAS